jgi:hypothetical protein
VRPASTRTPSDSKKPGLTRLNIVACGCPFGEGRPSMWNIVW